MTAVATTDVADWISGRIAFYGIVDAADFTVDTPLAELGLDSVFALTLCGDLEDQYRIPVDPEVLARYGSIRELAAGIAAQVG